MRRVASVLMWCSGLLLLVYITGSPYWVGLTGRAADLVRWAVGFAIVAVAVASVWELREAPARKDDEP